MLESPAHLGRDGLIATPDTGLARTMSGQSSHFMTLPSSWSGTRRGSAQNGRPPIAWAGVRHQIKDVARTVDDERVKEREQMFGASRQSSAFANPNTGRAFICKFRSWLIGESSDGAL
jgi:hypothetical protein